MHTRWLTSLVKWSRQSCFPARHWQSRRGVSVSTVVHPSVEHHSNFTYICMCAGYNARSRMNASARLSKAEWIMLPVPPNILKCSGYCGGYNSSAALRCLSDFAELSQQTHPAVKCFNQIKHLLLTCICRAGQHFARSACTSTPPLFGQKKKNPLYHPVYSSPAAVLTVLPLSAGLLFVWFLFLFYFFFFPFFCRPTDTFWSQRRWLRTVDRCPRSGNGCENRTEIQRQGVSKV